MTLGFLILLAITASQAQDPVDTVRLFCEARKDLDAARMEKVLADDYAGVQQDGSEVPYNRALAYPIADWEQAMNTKWNYKILGVNENAVTVMLTEKSDYFTYLSIGTRTQVTVYIVEGGKIKRGVSKLDVQERGSQGEEFRKFKTWLLDQLDRPEPNLVGPSGNLIFNGKSAPRMLYWLKKWHRHRNKPNSGVS